MRPSGGSEGKEVEGGGREKFVAYMAEGASKAIQKQLERIGETGFSIKHGLGCKYGGLVGKRNDDARDEAGNLAALALSKSSVSYEPKIFYGTDARAGQQGQSKERAGKKVAGNNARGDIAILGL